MGMNRLFILVKKKNGWLIIVMPRARTYCVAMFLKLGQNRDNKNIRNVFCGHTFSTFYIRGYRPGSKISIPIYSELYSKIVNVCCNIYCTNSDFQMTCKAVKFKIVRTDRCSCKYLANQSDLGNHGKARESREQLVITAGKVTWTHSLSFQRIWLALRRKSLLWLVGGKCTNCTDFSKKLQWMKICPGDKFNT